MGREKAAPRRPHVWALRTCSPWDVGGRTRGWGRFEGGRGSFEPIIQNPRSGPNEKKVQN